MLKVSARIQRIHPHWSQLWEKSLSSFRICCKYLVLSILVSWRMEVPSFSPLSGDGRLPLCAKRKINLRRVIFQSKPNDLQICAKQKAAFGSACSWHGLKDDRLKVQDVSSLYWDSYGVSWKMKGIFRKSMEEGKMWEVSNPTAIRFLWRRVTRRNAEMCTNVH